MMGDFGTSERASEIRQRRFPGPTLQCGTSYSEGICLDRSGRLLVLRWWLLWEATARLRALKQSLQKALWAGCRQQNVAGWVGGRPTKTGDTGGRDMVASAVGWQQETPSPMIAGP